MRSPYPFLLSRSLKNSFVAKLRRLRRPRYMISAIAGTAYLYFVFLRQVLRGGRAPVQSYAPFSGETAVLLETFLSVALLVAVVAPWIQPVARHVPLLTEAEVQFLLPAPLTRRSILRFRIIRGQVGILIAVCISLLLFAAVPGPFHPIAVAITLWVVYSFLGIYRLGVTLARTRIGARGVARGRLRRFTPLLAFVLLGVLLWSTSSSQERPGLTDPESVFRLISAVIAQPPVSYLLAPFRILVRPAFSGNLATLA
ncbi:MAG: hypothetical protein HXY20_01445, partial [Acidobacteria bacterium]|nr:hypothetical protein [Acidobacteriota bacterium]